LRRRLAPAFPGRPKAHEVLGEVAPVNGMAQASFVSGG
jgi:hypothetical protein